MRQLWNKKIQEIFKSYLYFITLKEGSSLLEWAYNSYWQKKAVGFVLLQYFVRNSNLEWSEI